MERRDAVVLGGGPAGSTCAWALRRAGLDVLVFDRAAFPRDKVCAGWITPQVVDALALDVAEYASERTFETVRACRTALVGGPVLETAYREPISYGIRRCEFDHYLLRRSGAEVRRGTVETLRRAGGDWIVNESIRAPVVIGAAGHFCPIARRLGAGPEDRPLVAAQEIELTLAPSEAARCSVRPGVPELHFTRDLEGYGWCFRKGSCLNVGFGRRGTRAFPAALRGFVSYLAARTALPEAALLRWRGHAYLLWEAPGRRLIGDGLLLVGDAAGLAYAQSGEGIRPAVESGLLAASVVAAAGGRSRAEDLAPYAEHIEARFGRRARADVARFVPEPWRAALGARLLATRWLTRAVVLDRWFLHRRQPPLRPAPSASRWPRSA